jgi:protein-S-isoprenylcysteine O-methyltransferase Ste14
MAIFKIIYWLGMIAEIIIRAPYQKGREKAAKTDRRVSATEKGILYLLLLGMFLLPLVYSVTNWLNFADYQLSTWLGWLGVVFMAGALFVFARAHIDLQSNWSPSLEIYEKHTLITKGIYGRIRHPMYASQLLWCLAQLLLLQKWLAGPIGLLIFIPFYLLRTRAEEKMMLETFGDDYRAYMQKVGGVFPKF